MAGVSRETQMSIDASSMFPGFRFSPTDVELISYYLKKKLEEDEKCVEVISEVDICRYEPWDLPAKSVIQSDNEWFFFSARGRKYPNGSQSKRATEQGYWKATGKERNVKSGSEVIGTKRTLVFHTGRAPKGERTEWVMHEYCMHGKSQDSLVVCRLRKNADFQRPVDTLNQASPNPRNLPTTHNSSNSVCGGGIDPMDISEVENAAECSKKCSTSYDSYSIEQFDSACESEQKLSNEVTLAESSSCQKDFDDEEELFADILKDDIVKLDETSFSADLGLLSVVANKSKAEAKSQQPAEVIVLQELPSQANPFQGTANRRIKLSRRTPGMSPAEAFMSNVHTYSVTETKLPSSGKSLKCVLGLFSARTCNCQLLSVIIVILTLLVLILSLMGCSQQIKKTTRATLYKSSLH